MKSKYNSFTKEYWRGEDKNTALDYVCLSPSSYYGSCQFYGRINGEKVENQIELKNLRDLIIREADLK